jgi:4a-hydroxytetrahydrobiopterin dehydratase
LTKLVEKQCGPCESGLAPLTQDRISLYPEQLPGWQTGPDGKRIRRRFEFKGFSRTMSLINALSWIANQQGHHPDFRAGDNYCEVSFTTHAISDLSENDFICASRVCALLES